MGLKLFVVGAGPAGLMAVIKALSINIEKEKLVEIRIFDKRFKDTRDTAILLKEKYLNALPKFVKNEVVYCPTT